MGILILYFLVGVFSHYFALYMVGYEVTEHRTFETFIGSILDRIYTGIIAVAAIVLGSLVVGYNPSVAVMFVTCVFFTLCRIDFEETYECNQEDID